MVLIFRVKWLTAYEYKMVHTIADPIGFDRESGIQLYRLNPVKAAKIGLDETLTILSRVHTYLPSNIRDLIKRLSEKKADIYLVLERPDIILYTNSLKFTSKLKQLNLVVWDGKSGTYRLKAKNLHKVLELARNERLKYEIEFKLDYNLSFTPKLKLNLREYQIEAYEAWVKGGRKGVIGLPVAAGKTIIALKAIEELKVKTLILVPTIDLLNQWYDNLIKLLSIPPSKIGVYGGGRREVNEVTIMTYDSACLNLERYPTYFGLIIADECHHAVSPSYRRALENSTAPYRMGLTATPFRSDGLHKYYNEVLGPIVYSLRREELQREGYLARHREKRIYINLSREELENYKRLIQVYIDYCERKIPEITDPKLRFRRVLELAARDPEAREALRAKHKARQIALSAEKKIKLVEELLRKHPNEKILIFSRYTDVIREISRRLLIPRILHDTSKDERKQYLKLFREGKIRILATAMALDEGVDVPDASMAIIISGTGSHREYVQRLGRILRPKEKEALLIELITKGTLEPSLAKRRRRFQIFLEEE